MRKIAASFTLVAALAAALCLCSAAAPAAVYTSLK